MFWIIWKLRIWRINQQYFHFELSREEEKRRLYGDSDSCCCVDRTPQRAWRSYYRTLLQARQAKIVSTGRLRARSARWGSAADPALADASPEVGST